MSGESNDLLSTLDLICAPKKLERERGEEKLHAIELTPKEITFLCEWIADKLEGLSNWEDVHGGLTAAMCLCKTLSYQQLKEMKVWSEWETRVLECHENWEYRVRILAGQLMGLMCSLNGRTVFNHFLPYVLRGVTENLERNLDAPFTETEDSLRELNLVKGREVNSSRSTLSIFHDTAGWKNLETWMKCLQQMVLHLTASDFELVERSEIFTLVFKAVQHTNRFVRETGYEVLSTLVERHGCYQGPESSQPSYVLVATQIVVGLSDNWSQVRMAASRVVRTFFEVDPPPGHSVEEVYPILLPPMCLNRYYVAEGVRIYSQDTWCQVTKGDGKRLIGVFLAPAVDYYIKQSDADNHAVREAACAVIAETVSKLSPDLLRPHIVVLLEALLVCFGDESWPVRDAACSALGTLMATFPSEAKEAGYGDLLAKHFLRNLSDSIPSVRDVAAHSIARILGATSDDQMLQLYCDYIKSTLAELKNQTADSHGVESMRVQGRGPGISHVIARSGADAHDARHTDQTMYSCGSLAPKLQKGRKGGGCHDGLNQRTSEPWERADGAIRLIGHIARVTPNLFTDAMAKQILEASDITHYTHFPYFLETASCVIAQLCEGLDKARFKRYLDDLLVVLAAAVDSQLPLAEAAAEETLQSIGARVGPTILRSRISNHMDIRVSRSLLPTLPAQK